MSGSYQKVWCYSRPQSFPFIEKLNQVFLQHSSRRFEFAIAAAVVQATVAFQNRDRRNSFVQRNLVCLIEFGVLLTLANVHMILQKVLAEDLSLLSVMH